jgi:tripartite ATP-independent transporter DctP family solute receptor
MRNFRQVTLLLGLLAVACVNSRPAMATAESSAGKTFTLRVPYPLTTTDHPYYVGLLDFKKRVEADSGGRLKVNIIHDPNLPPDAATLEQIRSGGYHLGLVALSAWVSYTKERLLLAWSLPFLYKDTDAAYRAWDSDAADASFSRYEKYGVKCIARWDGGFRSLSANKAVYSLADIKGLKIRVPQSHVYLDTWKALTAEPVTIGSSAEVYAALMTGVANATDFPVLYLVSAKLYEVQKYAIVINYLNDPICVTLSDDFYRKLPPDLQKLVQDAARAAAKAERADVIRRDDQALETLRSKGVTIITPNLAPFRDAVKPVYQSYIAEHGNPGLYLLESIHRASGS